VWNCSKYLNRQKKEPRRLPKLVEVRKKLLICLFSSMGQSLHKVLSIQLQDDIVACFMETFATFHAHKV
jgi:hypothetical protein